MPKKYTNKITGRDFFKRLGKLPEEAQDFFISEELAKDIGLLGKKFNLEGGFLAALAGDLVADAVSFEELLKVLADYLGDEFDEQTIREIATNFLGVAFLPVEKYLGKNIGDQIIKLGGNPTVFDKYVNKFQNYLQDKKRAEEERIFAEYVDSIDMASEKQGFIELFKKDLVDVLNSDSDDIKEQLNINLLLLLDKEEGLQKELSNILLNCQEKLTHKEFILEGKPHSPSIGNWLKDFIKQYGSGMFDNVSLSRYITNSPNTRKLDEKERKLLRGLLALYRNLKFFSESLENVPAEQWEIIPISKDQERLAKARTVSGPPKTENEKRAEELRQMAQNYPEGSLERRAIEEEGKRMNYEL